LQECESAAKSVQYLVTLVTPQERHPEPRKALLDLGKRYIRQILYCNPQGSGCVERIQATRVTRHRIIGRYKGDRDDESNRDVPGLGFMGLHLCAA